MEEVKTKRKFLRTVIRKKSVRKKKLKSVYKMLYFTNELKISILKPIIANLVYFNKD